MSDAVVYIAKCDEHGLHGEREECFTCGGPVEHVTYVRADMHLQVSAANGRKAEEIKRLNAENTRLREALAQVELLSLDESAAAFAREVLRAS